MPPLTIPSPDPLLIAHRAANDLSVLDAARRAGADIAEADVWRYRGRLEVRHSKTLGRVPVLWDRWSLTSGAAPRLSLDQVLEAAHGDITLMLDLKGADPLLPHAVIARLDALLPGRPVLVCSRNWDLLEQFRDHPHIRAVHSVGSAAQLRAVSARLTWHDRHLISIHRRLLSPAVIATLKDKAAAVITWPVNGEAVMRTLLSWGVDGVISDRIELLRLMVEQRRTADKGGSYPHG